MEAAHQACAEARNNSVDRPKVRRSRPRPIENQQLMFEQKRLGDNGTSAARSEEFDDVAMRWTSSMTRSRIGPS